MTGRRQRGLSGKKPAAGPAPKARPAVKDWPSPDPMGRVHCRKCGEFTANPTGVHGWCGPGGIRAWFPHIY